MSPWHDQKAADSVCNAAETWGFFQIVNHGVPLGVLEDVKEATQLFFKLPAAEKRKYSKENSPTSNVRFGTSFTPEAEKALEWKNYLSLFYVTDDEASTFWPPGHIWISKLAFTYMQQLKLQPIQQMKEPLPYTSICFFLSFSLTFVPFKGCCYAACISQLPRISNLLAFHVYSLFVFKNQAQEFIRSSELVIKKLVHVLMRRLNVSEIHEQKESMLMGSKRINLNYYPICPNPELTIRVGRHLDVSTLTVLQDDIGGLYVQKIWIPIVGSMSPRSADRW
ncbi:hypothetical protein RJ639_007944 [Escallonia herrerae]|uniref:Uncharacterized protein n=1 Tax=Escallonia herrerae TaxID=1293975 RepID=A0AA89AS23_9ASTE|nr:hypothetical protein RJ639_007944 [Escallonia herrerae]